VVVEGKNNIYRLTLEGTGRGMQDEFADRSRGAARSDASGEPPCGGAPIGLSFVPQECGVNRLEGSGVLRAGNLREVAAVPSTMAREPPISGTRGSGTVFFSHCNMKCLFCQNYPISQYETGGRWTPKRSREMLRLRDLGVHNINFVTPTPHVRRCWRRSFWPAPSGSISRGLQRNGYDALETLALLEGVVDIYLPVREIPFRRTCGDGFRKPTTPGTTKPPSARWCDSRVPFLRDDGVAARGVLVRHLVLRKGRETEAVLVHLYEGTGRNSPCR